jgi:hypothetical protein
MALVSGRPISFRMDLYQPLYVPRPLVVPELFASLSPVAYGGKLDDNGEMQRLAGRLAEGDKKEARHAGNGMMAKMPAGGAAAPASPAEPSYQRALRRDLAKRMELGTSVATVAAAAQLGDFFQYVIERPVTLPRQKSALLPIVGKDVEASRVSIYNEGTQPKFPLLGLKLKNTSGLHLMQGPVTVFEGSSYAGDARVADLQPNEERLISYAVDLGTEVKPEVSADSGRLTHVKAVKGTLHTTTKLRETKTYTVKNRNPQDRVVLIEHPVRPDFKLVSKDRPAETARDVYRFKLKVPAGQTAKATVTEERDVGSTVLLTNSPDEQVRLFLQSPVVSEKVKAGLQKAQELRWEWGKTQREIGEQQRQLQAVTEDQGRLRANLREVPQSSPLHKRYLEKLGRQEDEVEKYRAEVKKLQTQEHARKKALDDFLAAFSAD